MRDTLRAQACNDVNKLREATMTGKRNLICAAAVMVGALFVSTGAFAQGVPLFAVMNGGNECNGAAPPLCRQGDLDAFGSATIIFPTTTSLCFGIVVDNLAAPITGAHIHRGVSGVNGGIVVALTAPSAPAGGNPGASSGCVAGLSSALVAAIRANPSLFYVNVHDGAFPNGAIRGQLF
jgi:CHRD domain